MCLKRSKAQRIQRFASATNGEIPKNLRSPKNPSPRKCEEENFQKDENSPFFVGNPIIRILEMVRKTGFGRSKMATPLPFF